MERGTKSTILFVGSNRYGKIIEPLRTHHDVVLLRRYEHNVTGLGLHILSRMNKVNPEVVLCDDYQGVGPVIVAMIARKKQLPLIIRPRGAFWHRLHDRYEDSLLSVFYKSFFRATRAFVFRLCDGVLPISYFLRDQIIDRFDIDPAKVITVTQAVDLERFYPVPDKEKENSIAIITGFNFRKKYMALVLFADGIKRVLSQHPDWKLKIYGAGRHLALCKKEMASRLGSVAHQVHFPGRVERIEERLRKARVFVNVTYRETYPNVVLEAMASGVPVVVNRFGGNHEALAKSGGAGGRIIETQGELEEALNELIASEDLRRRVGEAGRQYVMKFHSRDIIGHDFSNAIEHIVTD